MKTLLNRLNRNLQLTLLGGAIVLAALSMVPEAAQFIAQFSASELVTLMALAGTPAMLIVTGRSSCALVERFAARLTAILVCGAVLLHTAIAPGVLWLAPLALCFAVMGQVSWVQRLNSKDSQ